MGRGRGEGATPHTTPSAPRRSQAFAQAPAPAVSSLTREVSEMFENTIGVDGMCAQAAVVLGWRLSEEGVERELVSGYYERPDGCLEDHCFVRAGEQLADPTRAQFDEGALSEEEPGADFSPYLEGDEDSHPLPDARTGAEVRAYITRTMSLMPGERDQLLAELDRRWPRLGKPGSVRERLAKSA